MSWKRIYTYMAAHRDCIRRRVGRRIDAVSGKGSLSPRPGGGLGKVIIPIIINPRAEPTKPSPLR